MVDHRYISGSMVVRKLQLAEKELASLRMLKNQHTNCIMTGLYNPVLAGVEACLENRSCVTEEEDVKGDSELDSSGVL